MPGEDVEAIPGDAGDGSIHEPDLNIVERKEQRDNLQRRVDMERSSINHALALTKLRHAVFATTSGTT